MQIRNSDGLSFEDSVRQSGMIPPNDMKYGEPYRIPGKGKGSKNQAGWCIRHSAHKGTFGDFSRGLTKEWEGSLCDGSLSLPGDLQTIEKLKCASNSHPYLVRKNVKSHGIKEDNAGNLVIPIKIGESCISSQIIFRNGCKFFQKNKKMKGGYHIIDSIDESKPVCVSEGYSTGATIHEATNLPTLITFSSGNMMPAITSLLTVYPDIELIICSDDDFKNDENTGLIAASEVAQLYNAKLAKPIFPEPRDENHNDFNDLASVTNLDEVCRQILNAKKIGDTWATPNSLVDEYESKPYPLSSLPQLLRDAIEEVVTYTQAPISLVVTSALSVLSTVAQGHVNVKRAQNLEGPASLYLLAIAESGERKSTCDKLFQKPIMEYQTLQESKNISELQEYQSKLLSWEAQKSAIIDNIKHKTKKGEKISDLESSLEKTEKQKPIKPLEPQYLKSDDTPENLAWSLSREWPSSGILSSEAGLVFGSQAMNSENIMKNLALP
ncbi:MAG: DUF3987 domain-containing protein [Oligoflexales bacterium]